MKIVLAFLISILLLISCKKDITFADTDNNGNNTNPISERPSFFPDSIIRKARTQIEIMRPGAAMFVKDSTMTFRFTEYYYLNNMPTRQSLIDNLLQQLCDKVFGGNYKLEMEQANIVLNPRLIPLDGGTLFYIPIFYNYDIFSPSSITEPIGII